MTTTGDSVRNRDYWTINTITADRALTVTRIDGHGTITLPADYADVPRWLAEDYPALFAHPRLRDRLRVYSMAYDLRELLMDPPDRPVDQLSHLHPYHRLADTVEGRGHIDLLDIDPVDDPDPVGVVAVDDLGSPVTTLGPVIDATDLIRA
mgnify:CR=1 FL=1